MRLFPVAILLLALAAAAPTPQPAPRQNVFAPPAGSSAEAMVWVEADPRACHSNPWDNNPGIGGALGFFQERGVQVYDNTTISYDQLYDQPVAVCKACTCPAGFTLYLLVNEKDLPLLQPLGFKVSAINPYDANTYVGSRHLVGPPVPAPAPPRPALKRAVRRARRGAPRRSRKVRRRVKRRRRQAP